MQPSCFIRPVFIKSVLHNVLLKPHLCIPDAITIHDTSLM